MNTNEPQKIVKKLYATKAPKSPQIPSPSIPDDNSETIFIETLDNFMNAVNAASNEKYKILASTDMFKWINYEISNVLRNNIVKNECDKQLVCNTIYNKAVEFQSECIKSNGWPYIDQAIVSTFMEECDKAKIMIATHNIKTTQSTEKFTYKNKLISDICTKLDNFQTLELKYVINHRELLSLFDYRFKEGININDWYVLRLYNANEQSKMRNQYNIPVDVSKVKNNTLHLYIYISGHGGHTADKIKILYDFDEKAIDDKYNKLYNYNIANEDYFNISKGVIKYNDSVLYAIRDTDTTSWYVKNAITLL